MNPSLLRSQLTFSENMRCERSVAFGADLYTFRKPVGPLATLLTLFLVASGTRRSTCDNGINRYDVSDLRVVRCAIASYLTRFFLSGPWRGPRQVSAPPPPPRSQASQAARGPLRLRSTPRAPSAPSASTSFSASHLPAPARRATRPAPRRQHLPPHPRAVRPSPPAGHTPRAPSAPGAPTLFSATHAQVPAPVLLAAAYPLNPFKCISAWSCTYSQDRL